MAIDTIKANAIFDGAVDTADLADGAVTSAKLDTNIDVAGTLDVTGAFTADSTGSVAGTFGIGTTSPGQTLEVSTGNDSNGIRIRRFSGSYYSDIVHTSTPEGLKFMVGNGASVTERLRILGSGGITFNGDTAGGALDDYEEGTWEMTVTDGTTSKSTTSNTYRKVGNLVFIRGDVQNVESGGAFSGQVYVSGLPFSTVGVNPISSLINYTATSTAWSAQVSASGVYFYKIGVTGSDFAQLQGSDLSYYSDISISGCYAVS